MESLLDAITDLVRMLSPEKIKAIAAHIRKNNLRASAGLLQQYSTTSASSKVIGEFVECWEKNEITPLEISSMLLASSYSFNKERSKQITELVWTGPTTSFASTRRTEQALIEVINYSKNELFITSFVAYDVSTIVQALNSAIARNVKISMLLELSQLNGGNITFDAIGKMQKLLPEANLYAWKMKSPEFINGSVHAKVAVADSEISFITSANLTGYAMEKNMEAGILLRGGDVPKTLMLHLNSLVDTKIISKLNS
jgi:phosphatidylserine/phosphatidylglycerophosphate/cardiolipin synthase-like enzyme